MFWSCWIFVMLALNERDVQELRMHSLSLSVWLLWWRKHPYEWCLFTNKSMPEHSRLSAGTQWYMGDEWSGKCIFHPLPLCLCAPYTHYTTGNTCNASRRDFWQRGGGNNFRKHAPFTFPLFLPPSRLSQWLGALMSAIDLVAGDNSFHRCDTPWWTGAPRTPRLIPSPAFQQASVGEAECRTHGGSIDLPRLDSQRGADAVLFCRLLYFCGPRHTAATICHHVWDRDSVWIKCVSSCVGCDI